MQGIGSHAERRDRRKVFQYRAILAGVVSVTSGLMGGHGETWAAAPTLARSEDRSRFEITAFATGLAFPTSMTTLGDGSLLVATSSGGPNSSLWSSGTGSLVRLVDTNGDGVADGGPQVMASGLPGLVTSVRHVGGLVAALSSRQGNETITLWRTGSSAETALAAAGRLQFSFPVGFEHTTYALATRPAVGGGVELYFNVGAKLNAASTAPTDTVTLSGSGVMFSTASLIPDSIYRVLVSESEGGLSVAAPTRIAAGLRNAAGMTFDAAGNLWLQDNGIDDPANRSRSLSADELNFIAAADVGSTVPNFGFAGTYTDYATGAVVGPTEGVTLPLAAFRPISGEKSEGAVELALAPAAFPADFTGGVFVPFSGVYNAGGAANDENPLIYCNPATGSYFHFIENQQMGHPNGLLATADALYLTDLSTTGAFYGTVGGVPADAAGAIYRIAPVPEPSAWVLAAMAVAGGAGFSRWRARRRAARKSA